jgi:hypothetical protein
MARHDESQGDDGKQAGGHFPSFDTPMNVASEGGAAPASNNLVPTAEFPDPLGLMPAGKGAKSLGPKG